MKTKKQCITFFLTMVMLVPIIIPNGIVYATDTTPIQGELELVSPESIPEVPETLPETLPETEPEVVPDETDTNQTEQKKSEGTVDITAIASEDNTYEEDNYNFTKNGADYSVSTYEGLTQALDEITKSAAKEATVVLTDNMNNTKDNPFVGLVGTHITVKSTEGNSFDLYVGDLASACTFDNITITNQYEIHANGHKAIFTAKINMELRALYGGAKDTNVNSTHLEVYGGKIGYKDFSLVGGSELASVEGDVYVRVGGTAIITHNFTGGNTTYKGGSANRYIGGNVTIIYDRPTTVQEIGDGVMGDILNISGTYETEIKGNLNITVKSGYVKGVEAQRGASPNSNIGGNVHLVVGAPEYENSDILVRTISNWGIYGAGSQFAPISTARGNHKVGGNVTVDTYENLWGWGDVANSGDYPPYIAGTASADVAGDVIINAQGSHMRYISGLRDGSTAKNVTINATDIDLDDHEYTSGNAPLDPRNGGYIRPLMGGSTASGNVVVNLDGGSLGQIYCQGYVDGNTTVNVTNEPKIRFVISGNQAIDSDEKSVLNFDGANAVVPTIGYFTKVNTTNAASITLGNETVNAFLDVYDVNINTNASLITNKEAWVKGALAMNAGSWTANGPVLVNETATTSDSQLIFNDSVSMGYAYKDTSNTNEVVSSKNDSIIFHKLPALFANSIYGHVSIASGSWTSLQPLSIKGNYVGEDNKLLLPAFVDVENYPSELIPVEIMGEATGNSLVTLIDKSNSAMEGLPIVGQNYINGKTISEDVFELVNENAKSESLYFKKVTDSKKLNYDMWQVAKKPKHRITYDFISGTQDMQLPTEVLVLTPAYEEHSFGTTVYPATIDTTSIAVAGGVWTFKGWDMGSQEVDKDITFIGTWMFMKNADIINHRPVIDASDKIYYVGDKHKPMVDVTATDKEDKDLTDKVVHLRCDVDTTKIGVYEDTFKVTDSQQAYTVKTVKIIVIQKPEEPITPSSPTASSTPSTLNNKTGVPETGDAANSSLFIALLGISAGMLLLWTDVRKKQRDS